MDHNCSNPWPRRIGVGSGRAWRSWREDWAALGGAGVGSGKATEGIGRALDGLERGVCDGLRWGRSGVRRGLGRA